jgi:capsular exopolysaccharide synthesis family protein
MGAEMTFRDYVTVLRDRWVLVVLGLILGISGGGAHAFLTTPMYSTGTTFFISAPELAKDASQAYQGSLLSAQKIKSYTQLATGRRIREQAAKDLGSEISPTAISASARPDTVLLTITATDPIPWRAQAIANIVAEKFTSLVAEVEKPTGKAVAAVTARVVQPAQMPAAPISPVPMRDLALGIVLGLMAGVLMALGRHALDRSVKTADLLAEVVAAPVLGVTAYDKEIRNQPLIVHDNPQAPLAEAFRQLRTNLQYVDLDNAQKLIVITSSLAEEGKTTTTCNLAIALAQGGRRVLLVEADLRRPRAGAYLGLENAVGLTSVLTGHVSLDAALQPWGDGVLDFLGSGPLPPNPSELLASSQMSIVLGELADRYDVVLFDAPPTLPVADAAVLAAQCHGVLFVARHGKVTAEQTRAAAETLHRVSATVLGAVLTMTPRSKRRSGYSYQYGYSTASAIQASKSAPLSIAKVAEEPPFKATELVPAPPAAAEAQAVTPHGLEAVVPEARRGGAGRPFRSVGKMNGDAAPAKGNEGPAFDMKPENIVVIKSSKRSASARD